MEFPVKIWRPVPPLLLSRQGGICCENLWRKFEFDFCATCDILYISDAGEQNIEYTGYRYYNSTIGEGINLTLDHATCKYWTS